MPANQPNAEHLPVSEPLAKALVASQFPKWSKLDICLVSSSGTDNTIFRLGENMCLRFPKTIRTEKNLKKEHAWLPKLTPLPLQIPKPLAMGLPEKGYPCIWCIFSWIDGDTAAAINLLDDHRTAKDIGEFINALQSINSGGGPKSGPHNNYRGVPLIERNQLTREAIQKLSTEFETITLFNLWDTALDVPVWNKAPVWLHGDIHSGNMLTKNGRLNAVIDFGLSGLGDPACDLMVGWTQFQPETRNIFRKSMKVDDATWERVGHCPGR
jgi:aminoglycoside phosphotransferase (APT) family kinase protein